MGSERSSGRVRWEKQFAAALRETDPGRLAKCIEAVEVTVLLRIETMVGMCASNSAEGNALVEALTQLETLKRERLGFVSCR